MSRRLRKTVALALCAWLLLLAGGYAAAFSAGMQHDLESVQVGNDAPPKAHGASEHGCAGHLAAHLLAVPDNGEAQVSEPRALPLFPSPCRAGAYLLHDPFYPPPKLLLA